LLVKFAIPAIGPTKKSAIILRRGSRKAVGLVEVHKVLVRFVVGEGRAGRKGRHEGGHEKKNSQRMRHRQLPQEFFMNPISLQIWCQKSELFGNGLIRGSPQIRQLSRRF